MNCTLHELDLLVVIPITPWKLTQVRVVSIPRHLDLMRFPEAQYGRLLVDNLRKSEKIRLT